MPVLTLQLFGSPQIIYDKEWIDLRSVKACALLFYLAVSQRSHSRLALAGLLWPDKNDAEARTNLRQSIYHIHLAIPNCLFTTRDSLKLSPELSTNVDVLHFEEQVIRGLKQAHDENGVRALQAAVSLYQGDFLSGLFVEDANPYEVWMAEERDRLKELAFEAVRQLTELAIVEGDYFEGLRYAEHLVALDPLNEESYYQAMQLRVMNGQTQAALAQFEKCRLLFAEQLGVQPGKKITQLAHDIRRGTVGTQVTLPVPNNPATKAAVTDPVSADSEKRIRHNLVAPLSSFVGRHWELLALQQILAVPEQRLVTLTGTGGVGKTRLATHLCNLLLPQFEDGIWLVDLLSVNDETIVEQAVISALAVPSQGQHTLLEDLVRYLAGKQILLLLDNCEHLIEAVAVLVAKLLKAAPQLRILATSREPLNIPGECCFTVPPLTLPHIQVTQSAQEIIAFESVQLFIQRASLSTGMLVLNEHNLHCIAQICRMLDGIPLAIELVAARTRALAVTQIARQLEEVPHAHFQLTNRGGRNAHPRHQTLYNSIEWSYNLLTPTERQLFEQLAVFVGGWSFAAAKEVCGDTFSHGVETPHDDPTQRVDPSLILDDLTSLVDKSLIVAETNGEEVRYRFLETIHRFALERLVRSGKERETRNRHLGYFIHFMEKWELPPQDMSRAVWQSLIMPDLDNIRGALSWSWQSGAAKLGMRLAKVTGEFWFSQGLHRESIHWIQSLLAMPEAAQEKELQLILISAMEFTHWWALGNYAKASEIQQEALSLAKALGDIQRIEKTLNNLGGVALRTGNYEQAGEYLRQSLASTEKSGNKLNRAWSSILLGEAMLAQLQIESSRQYFEDAAELLRVIQYQSLLAYPVRRLGQIANIQQRDLSTVLALYHESLALNVAAGEVEGKAACVAAYARLFFQLNAVDRSIFLCATVSAALEVSHSTLPAYDRQSFDELLAALQKLDIPFFAASWQTGANHSLDQAIEQLKLWLFELSLVL